MARSAFVCSDVALILFHYSPVPEAVAMYSTCRHCRCFFDSSDASSIVAVLWNIDIVSEIVDRYLGPLEDSRLADSDDESIAESVLSEIHEAQDCHSAVCASLYKWYQRHVVNCTCHLLHARWSCNELYPPLDICSEDEVAESDNAEALFWICLPQELLCRSRLPCLHRLGLQRHSCSKHMG